MADPLKIRRWQTGWSRLVLALLPVLLIAVRKHSDLLHPQFWADDGSTFFLGADGHPWQALFEPYAGYLQVFPRLLAAFGHFLPVFWLPAYYVLSSLAVVGLTAWTLLSPRVRLPAAWAAVLALGAVPHSGEVYLNLCNLQWILVLGLLALAATDDPLTRAQRVGEVFWMLLCGLTGPLIVFFTPFFLWRAWRRRSRWSWGMLGLGLACAGWQLSFLFGQKCPPPQFIWTPVHELAAMGHRLFLLGLPFSFPCNEATQATLGIGIATFCAWKCWARRQTAPALWILLAGALVLAGAAWYKCLLLKLDLADLSNGDRYFFPEKIFIVWLVAGLAATGSRAFQRTALALAVVALIMNANRFVYRGNLDWDWRRSSQIIRRGLPTRVPTPPAPWYFDYPGRPLSSATQRGNRAVPSP
jgi:hypothetical protein